MSNVSLDGLDNLSDGAIQLVMLMRKHGFKFMSNGSVLLDTLPNGAPHIWPTDLMKLMGEHSQEVCAWHKTNHPGDDQGDWTP